MDNNNNNNNSKANNDEKPSSSSSLEENVNPNPNPNNSRTPFTNLSQIDADLALARTLQDQERAYMLLRMNGNGGDVSDDESWETGSYNDDDHHHNNSEEYEDDDEDEEEEDAFDVHAHLDDVGSGQPDPQDNNNINQLELDPSSFPDDEAYARALQDAEDQEMAARLLALTGIHEMATEEEEEEDDDIDDQGVHSQDTWDDVDPDELSYEELIALGEVVGTESRGLSADSIASLRSIIYKTQNGQNGSNETCVICRLDYEDADNLILLSCKHSYHSECITNWLQINKVCPVCSTEVSTSGTAS